MKQEQSLFEAYGRHSVQPHVSPSELIAMQPEASHRFRSFILLAQRETVEREGRRFGHLELSGISESGVMVQLRRANGIVTDVHEDDFLLEIGSLDADLEIVTVRTVREQPDGDGASLDMLFDTPDHSYVISLSHTRCVLHDLVAGTEDRIMHHLEMFYRVEAIRTQAEAETLSVLPMQRTA